MNWKTTLEEKFKDQILKVENLKEDGLDLLDITVKYTNMDDVEKISKEINEYLDSLKVEYDFDSLLIHSPGAKYDYTADELENYINEKFTINLIKAVDKKEKYISELLEVNQDQILIKWNNKGQFKKTWLDKNNIKKIEKFIKF